MTATFRGAGPRYYPKGPDANVAAHLRQHVPVGIVNPTVRRHDARVSKIVLLSSATVRDQAEQVSAFGVQHKAAEDAIKASGIAWTILRCAGFATNTLASAASVRAGGTVRARG
jgi:uncharacterized protein YbjT (DUF2867 family)